MPALPVFILDSSSGDFPTLELFLAKQGFAPVGRSAHVCDLYAAVATQRPAFVTFIGAMSGEARRVRGRLRARRIPTLGLRLIEGGRRVEVACSGFHAAGEPRLSTPTCRCLTANLEFCLAPWLDVHRNTTFNKPRYRTAMRAGTRRALTPARSPAPMTVKRAVRTATQFGYLQSARARA